MKMIIWLNHIGQEIRKNNNYRDPVCKQYDKTNPCYCFKSCVPNNDKYCYNGGKLPTKNC